MYDEINDYELIYMIEEENQEAKDMLFEKYRPFVEMKAKKYFYQIQNKGYELNDLIQEGMLALSDAINDYENNKNVKFSTFANICIDRQMITFIRDINRQKHQYLNGSISLDQSNIQDGRTLIDLLSDDINKNPLESFISIEEETAMKKEISKLLTDREREVFDLRLEGFSYQDIACLLNSSPKAVDRTIYRIKEKIEKNNLKKDID